MRSTCCTLSRRRSYSPAYRRKSKSLQKGAVGPCPAGVALRIDALCRYTDAVERHFRESVLEALPARYDSLLQQIEDNQEGTAYDMGASRACVVLVVLTPHAVPEPSLDCHVFCRVLEDKGDIEIDECVSHRAVRGRVLCD